MKQPCESAPNKRILVIDDDAAVRRLVRRALTGLGFEVVEIDDGSQALNAVRSQCPCLVLLDLHMPRLDGLAVLTELREFDPELPIIMLTGDSNLARARLVIERGALDFIAKPFDVQQLRDAVFFNSFR